MGIAGSGIDYSALRPEIDHPIREDALTTWRLCTNFVSARDILDRFGEWPDNLLDQGNFEPLYKGEWKDPIPGLAAAGTDAARPLFPFLDEAEAERILRVYEPARESIYPDFAAFLKEAAREVACGADGMLLAAQTLLVLSMREREKKIGIWDMRTPQQKIGAVFALGVHIGGTFSRVSALVAGKGMRLCVPWGGAYGEYSKILPILENPYSGWLLRTSDEELNVLMGGLTSWSLELLEFIDASKLHLRRGQARLNVDLLPGSSVLSCLPALRSAIAKVADGASKCLSEVVELWKTGRYSYLEGPGDYLEMSYSVLLGLLFLWAMEDGLLKRTPSFVRVGEPLVPKKSILASIRREKPRFNGIYMLTDSDAVWQALVATCSEPR
ncbi:MAG TPA: hypothetical protein GX500_06965 [Firmicutes bacterium]|nr:hypothetical protein [Candidatus Fermentithermobacillaceae bacterium]